MLARSCSTAWHLSFGNTYILNLWTPLAKLARCPFGPLLPRGSGPTLPVLPRGPPYIYYVGDLNFLFFLFRLYIIIYPLKFKYRPLLLRFLLYLHNNKCPLSLSLYIYAFNYFMSLSSLGPSPKRSPKPERLSCSCTHNF